MTKKEAKYKKKIGKYTIVADLPPKVATSEKSSSSYDSDFDKTYFVKNLYVEDKNGNIISPIIDYIETLKDGYIMTFSMVFWRKGFFIFEDHIYFIIPGEEKSFGSHDNLLFELKEGIVNNHVSFDKFIDTMLEKSKNSELYKKINYDAFAFHEHMI